jgi:tetratricopeptide (TPR) repeat protein
VTKALLIAACAAITLSSAVVAQEMSKENRSHELNNKGVKALNQGDFASAMSFLQQALEVNPENIFAKENLAIACNNKALRNPPAQAIPWFYRAMYLQPGNTTTKLNMTQAFQLLSKSISTAEANSQLAHECEEKGNFIGACVHYKLALDIAPDAEIEKRAKKLRKKADKQMFAPAEKPEQDKPKE